MTDPGSKALKAYEEKYKKKPKDGATLVAFVKGNKALTQITQEQAKTALIESEKEKTPKKEEAPKEKIPKKEEASKEKTPKQEEAPAIKETAMYAIGDEVLMSKDRVGVVRYVGELKELGTGLWYGVELTDGSIGQSDGTVHGKQYFATEGKRALFVQSAKIRRKMNQKDHKKHDSKLERPEPNRSEKANTPDTYVENEKAPDNTAYEDVPEMSVNSILPASEDSETVAAKSNYDSKAEESPASPQKNRRPSRSTTLTKNAIGVSAAETFETLLTFILRQSEDLREQLLDVYANPDLHPILVSSYGELKNMDREEQERVWNALLIRWKRYA